MAGILRGILRAAIAQPWDYMGEGAPNEWEFRLSPDEDQVAMWSPAIGEWVLFSKVTTDRTVKFKHTDRELSTWKKFVEELDDEAH